MPPISRDWEEEGGWHQSITPVTLSQSYTAIETARRAVVLALQAWKLKHGSLPKSLDELVGPYLDDVSIDPYSYGPFRYFRDGLEDSSPLEPAAVWLVGASRRTIFRRMNRSLVGRPENQRPNADDQGRYFLKRQYLVRSYRPYATPRFRSWSHKANSEYNIWEEGWPFPIP